MSAAQADMPVDTGLLTQLSSKFSVPEAAVRLVLTLLAGYPITVVYKTLIVRISSKPIHHIYFALCGFLLCVFNYGTDTYHSLVAIWLTYLIIRLLYHAQRAMLITNFIFNMSYLLLGYYFTASNEYDILWTMPHCVLTLRLIGFGFDVSDGRKPSDKLSKDQKETALEELPTLLELIAFAYYPSSFLVGPQFPFRRYKHFIDGDFRQYTGGVSAGLQRLLLGIIYLAVRQVGAMLLPDSYFMTDAYRNEMFIWRLVYLGLWAKLALYKYISCWLITEGATMCIGLSYNGKTESGENDWSGCSNVKLKLFETGNTMGHYVQSFNVNTNQWVSNYVYKRLKFLNNRMISYAAALGFLAVWHGFHSGYYMSFFIEYSIVTTEKQIETLYNKDVLPKYGHILNKSKGYKALLFLALKSYNLIYMGWCLTPFVMLSYERWFAVMKTVNFFGFAYILLWLIIKQIYLIYQKLVAKQRFAHTFSQATELSPTVSNAEKED